MLKIEKQIIGHEGFEPLAYKCSAGKLTIGYGRNLEDKGITQDEARIFLMNDIMECESDLCKIFGVSFVGAMDNNRRHALIDMRYNLGSAGFRKFRQMIRAIKNEDYVLAAEEMKDSIWYHQVRSRAKTLCDMMLHGGDE